MLHNDTITTFFYDYCFMAKDNPRGGSPSFLIVPSDNLVNETDGKTEPSVVGYGLAAETKNKIAKRALGIRQAYVKEVEMGIIILPSIIDGLPNGYHVGMEVSVAFPFGRKVPQEGFALRVSANTSTNDFAFV